MKKLIALLIALVLVCSLAACGGSKTPTETLIPTQTSTPTEAATPTPIETTTPVPDVWKQDYYVDDFKQPTKFAYVMNTVPFIGTFSNSATTDSPLLVDILIDHGFEDRTGVATIFLYEYASNLVKNSGSYDEEYDISIKTDDGTVSELHGAIYPGADRIVLEGADMDTFIAALSGEGNVSVYIVQSDRTTTTYLFTAITAEFLTELEQLN